MSSVVNKKLFAC